MRLHHPDERDVPNRDEWLAISDDACDASPGQVDAEAVYHGLHLATEHQHTQEDVLFVSWLQRQDLGEPSADETARLREEFFSSDQACLRASPLPKRFGWGLSFDDKGGVALCPMESEEYRRCVESGDVKVMKGMRFKRA